MTKPGILLILIASVAVAAMAQEGSPIRYDNRAFDKDDGYYTQKSAAIPADVVAAVKATKTEQNRDITGTVFFKDQVLKASTLRFEDRSTLVFADPTLPWVAIATRDLVIDSPSGRARITRPLSPEAEEEFAKKLRGGDGAPGAPGGHATGVNQHGHGYPGGDGASGQAGTRGATQQLPILYIFAGRVRWGTTPSEPPRPGLLVAYDGIRGGHGGKGGAGGIGGNGYRGDDGDSTATHCRKGPGDGGNGGFGGRGGRGGGAGHGGDGGSVILAGPNEIIADFILARQEGGLAGDFGQAGSSVRGGSGARGGRPRGHCHGNGRNGIDRTGTILTNNGPGDPARDGLRGSKDYVGFAVELVF